MARDDYKRQRNAKQHGGAIRHVVGLFASFLCGYLVANVVDLPSTITWVSQHWVNYQGVEQGAKTATAAAVPATKTGTLKPKFEFYTLLSKDNNSPTREIPLPPESAQTKELTTKQQPDAQAVAERGDKVQDSAEAQTTPAAEALTSTSVKDSVPVTESQPIAPASESSTSKLVKKETYMIQVAAVTRYQDAEHLKASLTLKGYGVMIISPTDAKTNWYRIVIGPFHSRAEAEKAQLNVARTEHIQGMIRKVDV